MDPTPPFVPPHPLTDTRWYELREGRGDVDWSFEEDRITLKLPDGSEVVGGWTAAGGRLAVQVVEAGGSVTYTAPDPGECARPGRMLELEAAGPTPGVRQLRYSGGAAYTEDGVGSREWYYYWDRYVPDRGQADTVQGEVLRVTFWLAAMYRSSGGGNWPETPGTYDAYADLAVAVLADGTLGEGVAEFVRLTVTALRCYCRENAGDPPADRDVDRLTDLALDWCRTHPYPVPRQPDPRMEF